MGYISTYHGDIAIHTDADNDTINPIIERFLQLVNDSITGDAETTTDADGDITIDIWGEGKWYEWSTDLDGFVGELAANGCMVNGWIERSGEEDGDFERWDCIDNRTETRRGAVVYATDAELLDIITRTYAGGPDAILGELKHAVFG